MQMQQCNGEFYWFGLNTDADDPDPDNPDDPDNRDPD